MRQDRMEGTEVTYRGAASKADVVAELEGIDGGRGREGEGEELDEGVHFDPRVGKS